MDNEQVEFSVFANSAVQAVMEALEFARGGDASALQSVLNEIAVFYFSNYTDSTQPEADASDVLNDIDLSSLVVSDSITAEEVEQYIFDVLSVPEELANYEGKNQEEYEDESGEKSQVEAQDEAIQEQEQEQGQSVTFFNFQEEVGRLKSQQLETNELLKQVIDGIGKIERAFTVTAPEQPVVKEASEGEGGAKTSKVHELKFGQAFKGGNTSKVDDSAVERMTRMLRIKNGGKRNDM